MNGVQLDAVPEAVRDMLAANPALLAALLDDIAVRSRDGRIKRAAGVLRGRRGGRPCCDDAASLPLMRAMLDDGAARSADAAALLVARTLNLRHEHLIKAAAARLARKFRAAHKQTANSSSKTHLN